MEPFEVYIWKRMLLQVGGVIAIAIILGLFVLAYNGTYHQVVNLDQQADERWSKVMGDLVERYGPIPGLASDVEPSLGSDAPALESVTRDLGRWNEALSGGDMGRMDEATTNLEASLSALVPFLGEHPDLAASGEVREFLASLERTEEEAAADRVGYNEAVSEYNRAISTFPASLWTVNWGFSPREYFTAMIGGSEPTTGPSG
jgi:LemA protein